MDVTLHVKHEPEARFPLAFLQHISKKRGHANPLSKKQNEKALFLAAIGAKARTVSTKNVNLPFFVETRLTRRRELPCFIVTLSRLLLNDGADIAPKAGRRDMLKNHRRLLKVQGTPACVSRRPYKVVLAPIMHISAPI